MKMDTSKAKSQHKSSSSNHKKKSKMSGLTKVVLILAMILLIVSLVMGALVLRKYSKLEQDTEKAKELYNPTSQTTQEVKKEIDPQTGVIKDFKELFTTNSDIRGWISIPDTGLDQPVVQSTDNEFYLYRNVYKEKSALGIPFVDSRAFIGPDHISTNLTIYGHAAKNGTFFAPVKKI